MHNESLAWLVVRTLGLLSLCLSAYKAFYFSVNLTFILMYEPSPPPAGDTIRLPGLNWEPLVESILMLGLAIYFLRAGKLVHGWLVREGRNSGKS